MLAKVKSLSFIRWYVVVQIPMNVFGVDEINECSLSERCSGRFVDVTVGRRIRFGV